MKNLVEQEREKKGLSRKELADLVGVSRQTIYFIETDKYNPSIFLAHDIAKLFGKTIEEIFLFEEDNNEK